jgi:hypothetical protein
MPGNQAGVATLRLACRQKPIVAENIVAEKIRRRRIAIDVAIGVMRTTAQQAREKNTEADDSSTNRVK